jgi:hypothetical protein
VAHKEWQPTLIGPELRAEEERHLLAHGLSILRRACCHQLALAGHDHGLPFGRKLESVAEADGDQIAARIAGEFLSGGELCLGCLDVRVEDGHRPLVDLILKRLALTVGDGEDGKLIKNALQLRPAGAIQELICGQQRGRAEEAWTGRSAIMMMMNCCCWK